MSRNFLSFPLGLATLLCLGAVAAQPAHAGITINSISGVPNLVPAAGAFVPVLIDCGGTGAVPTGTATLTDSDGKVVSQNPVGFYQKDANGGPIVYAYVVFAGNANPSAKAVYILDITVNGSDGSDATQSLSVTQGFSAPVVIQSIAPSPRVLQAADSSLSVSAALAFGGNGQGSYVQGEAILRDSSGKALEEETLSAPQGAGSPVVTTTFSQVPANTSASAQSYTITVLAEDSTGVWSSASTSVTQLPAGNAAAPQSKAGTILTVTNPVGKAGRVVSFLARLRRASGDARLSGETLSFAVAGEVVGTGRTNADGLASFSYTVPSALTPGSHSFTVSFAGGGGYAASSKEGSLTVVK